MRVEFTHMLTKEVAIDYYRTDRVVLPPVYTLDFLRQETFALFPTITWVQGGDRGELSFP